MAVQFEYGTGVGRRSSLIVQRHRWLGRAVRGVHIETLEGAAARLPRLASPPLRQRLQPGAVRLVQVQPDLWVQWLTALARHARRLRASVHMPRIGCGLAGGTWDKIEPIVIRTLCERDVPARVDDFG